MTATVTTETCFDCPAFVAWWDDAHGYQLTNEEAEWALGTPDDGWALDCLVDCYNRGLTPKAAIDETVEGYDPTPDYMPIGEMF